LLDLLLRYLPEREAPRHIALMVVIGGTAMAMLFALAVGPFVDESVQIAPFTAATLVAVIFAGRSAGFAALLANTALACSQLSFRDPALTFGTFFFQLVFGAATFAAGDALRLAARQLLARQGELQARERVLAALVEELDHRSKNMLAVVQLLARQTAANTDDLDTFEPVFQSRLAALGRAQSVMIRARWGDVPLAEIVAGALAPFRSASAGEGLQLIGGAAIEVDGRCGLGLALTLHELATNAGKYGALARPEGRVTVAWTSRDPQTAELTWRERGGPAVTPPTRKGFGSKLVTRMLEPYGQVEFDFAPEGLTFRFVFTPASAQIPQTLGVGA
jgi:two-component sensor histidine kinase